ncbi:MAG: alanine--tRNA ligase [Patescibacteria group bacterium]
MQSDEIRERFLNFFGRRGHAIIPSAPLVPENDPSVLFNTAGMQPIVPYLLGEKHPSGTRLVNVQKCVRTNDIDEVGDKTHLTFFEMLGNWSLGDYFKQEAIGWSFEFLTNKEEGLGLDPSRLYVTVFKGNDDAPKDTEAVEIWKQFIPEHRIYYTVEDNWWSPGANGPCGPDSEMFYDVTRDGLGDLSEEEFFAADERQDVVEIWNDVFMEYLKKDNQVVGKLESQNVDTGSGLERVTAIMQGVDSPYETDLFDYFIKFIEKHSQVAYRDDTSSYRIIADHMRSAIFLIADGVRPSNKDQGYILRRLLRRAVGRMRTIEFDHDQIAHAIELVIHKYSQIYKNLATNQQIIIDEIIGEIDKFKGTLEQGLKEFAKVVDINNTRDNITVQDFGAHCCYSSVNQVSAEEAYMLFTTYGLPIDIIVEEAQKHGLFVDTKGFEKLLAGHQEQSRTASAGKFKGGLADDSPKIRALHTATHLMLAGLRKELGHHIHQAGSNITAERTRFDFTNETKVSREVLDKVEEYVNRAIEARAEVVIEEMGKNQAKQQGVEGSFWEKYPDTVKVYTIQASDGTVYSRELCGGPHVADTGELAQFGSFKIIKEESSSAGVRRVKAVLA